MIRAVLTLLLIGLAGMFVLSLIFGVLSMILGILFPILLLALKIGAVLLIGYFVLRLVNPSKADEVRSRMRRVK